MICTAGGNGKDDPARTLESRVRPPGWTNPEPAGRYDLVAIGGGTAGLVSAVGAAAMGARVALVERDRLGGDCLLTGCVPSKALLRSARAVHAVRSAGALGVDVAGDARADFARVMERMRRLRAEIAADDAAERLARAGVDVFFGRARFVERDALAVDGLRLRFAKACIATGSRPRVPPVDGLDGTAYHTNETIFELRSLPARIGILGGGPIGCELAQAFARFGARVELVEHGPRLLAKERPAVSELLERRFAAEEVGVHLSSELRSVRASSGELRLFLDARGGRRELPVDELLVAVGRAPNTDGLDLERAGVEVDERGRVRVDRRLRTTNRRVYAAGDACFPLQFTHAADATARAALQNALFFGRVATDELVIPWCTFTDPEVAHVGLDLDEARERGLEARAVHVPLAEIDRARLDGETEGFLEVCVGRRGRILGATLVSAHAGETISTLTLAIREGLALDALAGLVHPYPTQAHAIGRAADRHRARRLTPRVVRLVGLLLRLRR